MDKKTLKRNRKRFNTHISLHAIKKYLTLGVYPGGSTPSEKRSLRKRSESFKIKDDELHYVALPKQIEGEQQDANPQDNEENFRKVIYTTKDQLSVSSAVHVQGSGGNHMGTERTLSALTSKYYWIGMAATVRKVLQSCVVCLASRPALAHLSSQDESVAPTHSWETEETLLMPCGAANSVTNNDNKKIGSVTTPVATVINHVQTTAANEPILSEGDGRFVTAAELPHMEEVTPQININLDIGSAFDPTTDFHMAKRFWEKVEVQVLGPFSTKSDGQLFVVAALDSFTKWPEIQTIRKLNEISVTRALLKLISRFGVMEQVVVLHNSLSATDRLDVSSICENLHPCVVDFSQEKGDPCNESWNNLTSTITRFISVYTDSWEECLEIALLPLRNNVDGSADFTPSFLVMGREANFPQAVLPPRECSTSEVNMNLKQISQVVDGVMRIYNAPLSRRGKQTLWASSQCRVDELGDVSHLGVQPDSARKPGRKSKDVSQDDKQTSPTQKETPAETNNQSNVSATAENVEDILEKLPLDTYYSIIHLYLSEGRFPANSSPAVKQNIQGLAGVHHLQDGVLMFSPGDGSVKTAVVTTEDCIVKMEEAHIQNGEHVSQIKAMEFLNKENVHWKGMHMDVKAYIVACPRCKFGGVKARQKARNIRWFKAVATGEEEEVSDSENTDLSFDDVWLYIKKGVTPDTLSRSELLMFRKRANSFKIEKGTLYYHPKSNRKEKPRKVLKTNKEKLDAMQNVHIGAENEHLQKTSMVTALRESLFWFGMSKDVEKFLISCNKCQPLYMSPVVVLEKRSEDGSVDPRLRFFQDYHAGKDVIPKLENLDLLFPPNEPSLTVEAMDVDQHTSSEPWCQETVLQQETSDSLPLKEEIPLADETGDLLPKVETQQSSELGSVKVSNSQTDNSAADKETEKETSNLSTLPSKTANQKCKKLPRSRKRCEVCHKVILGENNLKAHMYKHTGIKPYECNVCHKKFTNVKGLKLHSRKHTGHRPYLCNVCGRGFPRSASLRYHIKTHDRNSNGPITCDVCNRVFSTMNRMIKHKTFKHPAEKPTYSCKLCDKSFTAKRSLKRHEEAHQGIRKYVCQYCKRRFFRKEYLNYHLVSHANEDPSLLDTLKLRTKSKRQLTGWVKKPKEAPPSSLFTLAIDQPAASGVEAQDGYNLVEVPDGWSQLQRDQTVVYEIGADGSLVPSDMSQLGQTTMVVMEAQPGTVAEDGSSVVTMVPAHDDGSSAGRMEMQHIFLQPAQDDATSQVADHHHQHEGELPPPTSVLHHHHLDTQPDDATTEMKFSLNQLPIQYLEEDQTISSHVDNHSAPMVIKMSEEELASLRQQHHQQQQQQQVVALQEHQFDATTTSAHHHPLTQGELPMDQHHSIEISLEEAHTLSLPGPVSQTQTEDDGSEGTTVQYQVECLSGETLTEADFNAIRMLAQASLSGGTHNVLQQ